MTAKEEILHRLRTDNAIGNAGFGKPDLMRVSPMVYPDPVVAFINTATTSAGARVIEMKEGYNLQQLIRQTYPQARRIASNVEGVQADVNPDEMDQPQMLDGTDVGVIRGDIGCAENACIWVPQRMKQRAVCFISEQLVILLSRKDIVSNMHEAYERLDIGPYGFGTFISGPSKTADIEQSLVYGAQAARGVTIILMT